MTEYIYTSENEVFLPWDIWVITFGTDEEIDLHQTDGGDVVLKELLYQKWLRDQKIVSMSTVVDGETIQTMNWYWD
jgi:hypothetical protein